MNERDVDTHGPVDSAIFKVIPDRVNCERREDKLSAKCVCGGGWFAGPGPPPCSLATTPGAPPRRAGGCGRGVHAPSPASRAMWKGFHSTGLTIMVPDPSADARAGIDETPPSSLGGSRCEWVGVGGGGWEVLLALLFLWAEGSVLESSSLALLTDAYTQAHQPQQHNISRERASRNIFIFIFIRTGDEHPKCGQYPQDRLLLFLQISHVHHNVTKMLCIKLSSRGIAAGTSCLRWLSSSSSASSTSKVVIFGGSGFVGRNVCEAATRVLGLDVVSVSRSGRPTGKLPSWADDVQWVKGR